MTLRGDLAAAHDRIKCFPWVRTVDRQAVSAGAGGAESWSVAVSDELTAERELLRAVLSSDDVIVTHFGRRRHDLEDVFVRLSKPLSRTSFILAKFVSNAAGILVTAVLIPGMIAYGQIWAIAGSRPSPVRFLIAMMVLFESLMFYLALTLLLVVLFRRKSPVIGTPLAPLFGHDLLVSLH